MHNDCIVVEKTFPRLDIWKNEWNKNYERTSEKLGKNIKAQISHESRERSDFLVYISIYVPVEFPRKTRTLNDFPHLKATEHQHH